MDALEDSIDLNKLRTFFVIAEQGGVTAAAERLSLTRSAVSHSLTSLEQSLGVALFHRVGKRMVLSDEGAAMRRAFADANERIGNVLEEIGIAKVDVQGVLRVGLFLGFSRFRLAAVIDEVLAEHPGARVRLAYGSQSELRAQLLSGKLDLVLSLASSQWPDGQVDSVKLFDQQLVLAAARRPRKSSAEAIRGLRVIDYFRGEPLIDRWMRHQFPEHKFGRHAFPRDNIRVYAQSSDLAVELCLRGVGACVLSEDIVAPYRERGELVVIRDRRPALRDPIYLKTLRGGLQRPRVRAFLSALSRNASA
jgi:DNA-binding transcriptional LysR family regulator